jgi:release factor glutamine methyltransferase
MARASTVHERIAGARQRLRDAGVPPDEAVLDARLLAQHVLGWDTTRILTSDREPAPPGFEERYDAAVVRRAHREPLAYITGTREFWNLLFEVTPGVLIPRPETELLVACALAQFPDGQAAVRIADVCTGSGCVAVAIAHERPRARIVATDVSEAALAVASRNADRLGVGSRVWCIRANLLDCLPGPFDAIVSNPPYVPERDKPGLQPEVRDFEPPVALFGGPDGLVIVEQLIDQATDRLRPGGALIFEFGAGQESRVVELISSRPGLTMVGIKPDLAGIPRVAIAGRQ